jgi:hypothetical protein
MIPISSQLRAGRDRARHPSTRRLGTSAGMCAIGIALAAGCSSAPASSGPAPGGSTPSGSTPSGAAASGAAASGSGGGGRPATARQAIRQAASQSQQVNSMAATLDVHFGGGASQHMTGTISEQRKPALKVAATFKITAAGRVTKIQEIVTSKDIYFKIAALAATTGKPWVKISLAGLSSASGASFSQLFQNLESSNPLAQARLLGVSKNAHKVGTQVVNGVPATEYAGSYAAADALRKLAPASRKLLGPMLQALGSSTVRFKVWIDDQHLVRKFVDTETISGQPATTTMNVTSINQPLTISLPPASQIASMPGI